MSLIDVAVEVDAQLDAAGVTHAFGGALALAYIIEPRGTVDIDVNVFAPGDGAEPALTALADIGFIPELEMSERVPIAGIRLRRVDDPVPLDVFPALHRDRYRRIEDRCMRYPFGPGGKELPFLSAEDLALFKLSFGRDKDWVDLRRIAAARPDLDVDYIEEQLVALRGPSTYPRVARLRSFLRTERQ